MSEANSTNEPKADAGSLRRPLITLDGFAVTCGVAGVTLLLFVGWGGGWTAFALLMLAIGVFNVSQILHRLDKRISELEITRGRQAE